MAVAQVGYRDYWNFLIRRETRHWDFIYKGPDGVISIPQPDDFNLASMMQKVTTATLQERVVLRERCVVDQLFILNTPELSSILRVGYAVERVMRNAAIGSTLLTVVIPQKTHYTIRLVSLAMTCFTLWRYLEASVLVKVVQKKINEQGAAIAALRKQYYSQGNLSTV